MKFGMGVNKLFAVALLSAIHLVAADNRDDRNVGSRKVKHVLLLSIDGMHAVDFFNCAHGVVGANDGNPYCPNLTELSQTAINYVGVSSSKPSDSFPGTAALMTGGSPKSTGLYYDVAY